MSQLDSTFTRKDLETLIESIGDWEMLGNNEFHALQMVKNIPLPPEDHEAYEYVVRLKDAFRSREREIMDSRIHRQEQAVFLKAKLMMARKDLEINQVFDMAAEAAANGGYDDSGLPPAPVEMPDEGVPEMAVVNPAGEDMPPEMSLDDAAETTSLSYDELKNRLELAEFFIRDLGVQSHYEKFLAERSDNS